MSEHVKQLTGRPRLFKTSDEFEAKVYERDRNGY